MLESISAFLKTEKVKIAVISGPSGFGKTQIAKQFAYKNYSNYDVVWWFKGNQYLEPQFENFTLSLGPFLKLKISENPKRISHGRLVDMVKDALRKQGVKCLIVFDDVKTFKTIEAYIPFSHENNIHILITTKNDNFSGKPLRTKPFNRQESIDYIQHFLPREIHEAKNALAEYFNDSPSSLAQSIDYIKKYPGMTIHKYLERHDLEDDRSSHYLTEASQKFGSALDFYELGLYRAIELNILDLKKESRPAFSLLAFLSLLHHSAITTDDIQKWLDENKINKDPWEFINMVNQNSILDTENASQERGNITMHELIQKIIGSLIPMEEKKQQIEIALKILTPSFLGRTDQVCEKVIRDNSPLLHAIKISVEADKIDHHSPELLSLRTKVFDILVGHVRDYKQSKLLADHIESDLRNGMPLSKEDELQYNSTLFLYHFVFSPDYEAGIKYGEKAVELVEKEQGMFEEKVRLYANLLQHCCLSGHMEDSHKYIARGNSCFPHSKSSAYNALYIFAVAMFYNDSCEYEKTIDLIQENKSLLSQQGAYPSIRFFILNQLGEALARKGETAEALKALAQAEKLGRDYYSNEDNSFFGRWYVIKAICQLSTLQTCEQAKTSLTKALQIFEKIYSGSDNHRNQGITYLLLGRLYYLQAQYSQAKDCFIKSEHVFEKILKDKKVDDVSALYKSLAILGADSKDELLLNTYVKKHIRMFGYNHSRTKEIMLYLDKKGITVGI